MVARKQYVVNLHSREKPKSNGERFYMEIRSMRRDGTRQFTYAKQNYRKYLDYESISKLALFVATEYLDEKHYAVVTDNIEGMTYYVLPDSRWGIMPTDLGE